MRKSMLKATTSCLLSVGLPLYLWISRGVDRMNRWTTVNVGTKRKPGSSLTTKTGVIIPWFLMCEQVTNDSYTGLARTKTKSHKMRESIRLVIVMQAVLYVEWLLVVAFQCPAVIYSERWEVRGERYTPQLYSLLWPEIGRKFCLYVKFALSLFCTRTTNNNI